MRAETVDLMDSRGLRLRAFLQAGTGPTVLFAHAASMCAGVWMPIVDRLPRSAAIVAYDLRGHGDSEGPVGDRAYSWIEIARDFADVARWARRHFGRSIDICVTHSFSGDCALLACASERLPIDRLLLFEPVVADENGAAIGGPLLATATRSAAKKESGGFETPEKAAETMEQWIAPQLVSGHMDERTRAAFATCGVKRDLDGRYRFKCRRESEAEIYQNRRAIAAEMQSLAIVPQDVEVVFAEKRRVRRGEYPDAVRTRDLAQVDAVLRRCRRGIRTDMPNVGHFLPLEAPDAAASLVAARLGSPRA